MTQKHSLREQLENSLRSNPGHKPRHHNSNRSQRAPGKWDVSNRPEGDRRVIIDTDIDTLGELIIGFSFLTNEDPTLVPDEADKKRLKEAVFNLLENTRTKFRGRHPQDIELLPFTRENRPESLITLLQKMREQLR